MCRSTQLPVDSILDLERTSQQWAHGKILGPTYKDLVQARLREQYTQLKLVSDILEKILDSQRELEQLRVEQE